MLTEEQTLCFQCKIQYSEINPPRLLTMCGHTFCEKCIRELMSKKKMNNKYRLTCPLDKMATEISSPNPTVFPKNLSVLNLVRKKFQNVMTSRRISVLTKAKPDSCRSKASLSVQENLMALNQSPKQREEQKQKQKDAIFEQAHHNFCLLHQKPLQLICARDFKKICSSCVIFGQHRGHNVKSVIEVQDIVKKLKETLKMIQKQSSICFSRLQSKQISKTMEGMLQRKKAELSKQIMKRFQNLKQQINNCEKKTLNKLQKRIQEYRGKLQKNLCQKRNVRQKYRDWQQNLNQKLELLQGENEQNKLKTAFKSDNFLEVSERNLQIFKYLQDDFLEESERQLQNLALNYDQEEMNKYLRSFCKFQECNNSFLQMNASRITHISQLLHEEILLDDIQDPIASTLLSRQTKKSFYDSQIQKAVVTPYNKKTSPTATSCILQNANNKLNRMKSMGKQFGKDNKYFLSPHRKNSDLKSSRVMMGSQRSFLHGMLRSKQIPEKYEQKIEAILNGVSDTLDLTNGELSNEKVLGIIQCIKDCPVTIVKLVRNKLTDECLIKSIPLLNSIIMLNVSRNELTQKSLEFILQCRKEGSLPNLKSLMIGQNKILQRKNKETLENLRKMGINICN